MSKVILNTSSIQAADELFIKQYGFSELTLMESAGRSVVESIQRNFGNLKNKSFVVLCGKGNNGGDGLVVARKLLAEGCFVKVFLLSDRELKASVQENLRLLKLIQSEACVNNFFELSSREGLEEFLQIEVLNDLEQLRALSKVDFFVDALFGTGLKRELTGLVKGAVEWLNLRPATVVAIDLPSGLQADYGLPLGACVKADLTVTLVAPKVGSLLEEGPQYCGKIEIAEIGIPDFIIDKVSSDGLNLQAASKKEIFDCLPKRNFSANKYSVGSCLVIAASRDYTGAAYMASMAAARIGSGMVTCACPASAHGVLANKFNEVISSPMPETSDGSFSLASLNELLHKSHKVNSILIGCGLGKNPETQELVREFLSKMKNKVVIDADGLNSLEGHIEIIKKYSNGNWLLTPHWGEFKRLSGIAEDLKPYDRIDAVRKLAKELNCSILLKGFPSLIALPNEQVFLNESGNAAAATAGTGDVLAGICVGLMAQGLSPQKAAICGIYIAGLCAEHYSEKHFENCMIATDLLEIIPIVMKLQDYFPNKKL